MLEILDKKVINSSNNEREPISDIQSGPPLGLTDAEAKRRNKINGANKLATKKKKSMAKMFAGQFKDIMVMILIVATAISVALGAVYDALTIMLIVLINAFLGFIQEFRTERTLEALEKMTSPTAKVFRDGTLKSIPAEEIAEGDIFQLEAGDRVPCDGFVTICKNLSCDEAILTGEAIPVDKRVKLNELDTDNLNLQYMVYMGTIVTKGTCQCQCVSTGLKTQMGKVSSMLETIEEEETPLQKKLGELGKILAVICIAVCIIVFIAGVLRGEPVFQMLMTGITIAIAAIPEGLPAAVTIALALAVRRMLKRNALVHRLHSVETLGCASVICTDKTGTITENKMTVCKAFTVDNEFDFSGSGYQKSGDIKVNGSAINSKDFSSLLSLFTCAVACNNSTITENLSENSRNRKMRLSQWEVVGDPTEIALLVAGAKTGITKEKLNIKRIDEIPFESETRSMTVLVSESSGKKVSYTKGAIDVILKSCDMVMTKNGPVDINSKIRSLIFKANDNYANQALRVLAYSQVVGGRNVFLGLTAMIDPLRPEAKKAIRKCAKAHIKTVMITGDHKLTACAIAEQAGILKTNHICMTGDELSKLTDSQLDDVIEKVAVFARVTPDHKLRIVKAFKRKGHIVAMTGDGVNDAPAIKEANIGVSMGITGTDVTKQAADVILLDDNFSTLVGAVEQGRTIYANIRKFVRYLISCNIGEVVTMFVSIIMGLPIILLPTQILLVNLVTDGLPAIALGLEPPDENIMSKNPRKSNDSFFNGGLMSNIVSRGVLIGLFTIASFVIMLRLGGDLHVARTGALCTLVVSQLVHVFECKSEEKGLFSIPYKNNVFLIISVVISLLCLLAAIYIPMLATIFSTVPLNTTQLMYSFGMACAVPLLSSIFKAKK